MPKMVRGRPRRYAGYEKLYASLPNVMSKRPRYLNGVGIFRGQRGDTAWAKIRLPHGSTYGGKSYDPGASLEIKLGALSSFTWEQLEAKRAELQGKADRGEPIETLRPLNFAEWADDWLGRARNRAKAYQTLEIHLRCHLLPFFGKKSLAQITVQDVNRWIAQQLANLAPGTVKRQFNTLRAVLNDAIRAGQIEQNPCRHADRIRGAVARQRFLDGTEVVRLLATAETVADWLPDLILWAVHSGMRKGEFHALRWRDIRVIDDGRVVVLVSNSKADEPRMISCTRTMVEVLERQKVRKRHSDERVFPIAAMTLRRKWVQARQLAGLSDVTLHDLRRTHGTHAAAAGVDLRTLADRIGHADLTMLQKHYSAVVGDRAVEAAETFQDAFDRMTGADDVGEGSKC